MHVLHINAVVNTKLHRMKNTMLVTSREKKKKKKEHSRESFALAYTNSSGATTCKCLLRDHMIIGTDTTDNM